MVCKAICLFVLDVSVLLIRKTDLLLAKLIIVSLLFHVYVYFQAENLSLEIYFLFLAAVRD